jgi:hypothetical protein
MLDFNDDERGCSDEVVVDINVLNVSVPETKLDGQEYAKLLGIKNVNEREKRFEELFLLGHVPDALRELVRVDCLTPDKRQTVSVFVTRDYLTLATATDSIALRTPLWPLTAQRIADAYGCVLPTTKLVTNIWKAAHKLPPQPWGPPYDASMMSTSRIVAHSVRVDDTLTRLGVSKSAFIAGHKKDIVLTNQLAARPKQVAIFGWHQANEKPIQPLYLGHGNDYSDYAHGTRLVSKRCLVDNVETNIFDVFASPTLAPALSSEGVLKVVRQPLV